MRAKHTRAAPRKNTARRSTVTTPPVRAVTPSHEPANAPWMVTTQAHTTRPATPHRTADSRRAAPTPTIPPVIVWVVDTGMPAAEVANSVTAAADSAATPPTGWSLVMREPMVFTIRHPPVSVPRAMAEGADSTTHSGTPVPALAWPVAMSRARMTPIVFWASLAPWPRLKAAADASWPWRNPRCSRSMFRLRWKVQKIASEMMSAAARPISGDSTMNTPILRRPEAMSTSKPALATAAPAIPPTRACDELLGSPSQKVMRFHTIAPIRAAKITPIDSTLWLTTSLAMVAATLVPKTRKATKLKNAAHATAVRGESTRVDTTVAIELAASWKPLT